MGSRIRTKPRSARGPSRIHGDGRHDIFPDAPALVPLGSLGDHPSATLLRRVEVLEAQLRHLTRRLERERLI